MNWAERALQRMVKEINADPANSAAHMTKQYDEPCKELLKEFGVRAGKLLDDDNG